jgi:hypothetical protein
MMIRMVSIRQHKNISFCVNFLVPGTMMYRTASSDNMKASFLSAELPHAGHDDVPYSFI